MRIACARLVPRLLAGGRVAGWWPGGLFACGWDFDSIRIPGYTGIPGYTQVYLGTSQPGHQEFPMGNPQWGIPNGQSNFQRLFFSIFDFVFLRICWVPEPLIFYDILW